MSLSLSLLCRSQQVRTAVAVAISGLILFGLSVLSLQEKSEYAYTLLSGQWDTNEIGYRVNPNFIDASAGSSSDQVAAIRRAAETWCSEGQSAFSFRFDGESTSGGPSANGIHTVQYSNTDGGGALAVCYSWYQGTRTTNFDIEYYDRDGQYNFIWAINPNGAQFDIEGVGTHEFGHALGLGHSTVSGATMFASVSAGNIGPRTLTADDIAGVQAIYGAAQCGSPVTVTNLSPASGSAAGGTTVTISGTGFSQGFTGVYFSGARASNVNILSDTSLTCSSPPRPGGASSVADVVVNKPAGAGTANAAWTWQTTAASVTSVSPSSGPLGGGTVVTITGSGFSAGWTGVYFSGRAASQVQVNSDTQITCVTPASPSAGAANIVVNKPSGPANLPAAYSYQAQAVSLSSISPSTGSTAGGTQVTISGSGFAGGWTGVYFNGFAASNISVISDSELTCTTPPGSQPGFAYAVVNKPAGQGTNSAAFAYQATPPSITSIAPAFGPTSGGTQVTITGSGFATGWTGVYFQGVRSNNVIIDSDTQLRCVTPPASSAGPKLVVVNKPSGQATQSQGFTYGSGGLPATPIALVPGASGSFPHDRTSGLPGLTVVRKGLHVELTLRGGTPGAPIALAIDSMLSHTGEDLAMSLDSLRLLQVGLDAFDALAFDRAGEASVSLDLNGLDPLPLPYHFRWSSLDLSGKAVFSPIASLY